MAFTCSLRRGCCCCCKAGCCLLLQGTRCNPWPARSEIVHFLTDNDSIGEAVCKRAEALSAAAVVMAKHQRGAIAEFFLGSGAF